MGGMDEGISATGIASASENLGAPWNFVIQRALPKNTVDTLNPAIAMAIYWDLRDSNSMKTN